MYESMLAHLPRPVFAPEGEGGALSHEEVGTVESAAAVKGIMFGDEEESADDHQDDDDKEIRQAAEEHHEQEEEQEEKEGDEEELTDEEKKAAEEAKKAKEDDEEEEEDFLEIEIEGQEEPERISVSEVYQNHLKLQEVQEENEKLKRQAEQIPQEVDDALKATIETRQQLVQSLEQWNNLAEPAQPNRDLLNPENPDEKGGYDPQLYNQQLTQFENFKDAQAQAKKELEEQQAKLNEENAIRFKAVKSRAVDEIKSFWPEIITDKDARASFREDMEKHFGMTQDEIKSALDPRLFKMAKLALAQIKSEEKTNKAVKEVRGKPKLIKNKARTANTKSTNFNDAMEKLSGSGSDADAVAALNALS